MAYLKYIGWWVVIYIIDYRYTKVKHNIMEI